MRTRGFETCFLVKPSISPIIFCLLLALTSNTHWLHRRVKYVLKETAEPSRKRIYSLYEIYSNKGRCQKRGNFLTYARRAERAFNSCYFRNGINKDMHQAAHMGVGNGGFVGMPRGRSASVPMAQPRGA